MRTTALLLTLLTVALVAPTATAQPPSFDEPFQVRAAHGDIPSTTAVEPASTWNVEQRLKVHHDAAGSEAGRTHSLAVPGATIVNVSCTCPDYTTSKAGGKGSVTILPSTPTGDYVMSVLSQQPLTDVVGYSLNVPEAVAAVLIVYVPDGLTLTANPAFTDVGSTTTGGSSIHYVRLTRDQALDGAWFTVHPGAPLAPGTTSGGDAGFALKDWIVPIVIGLVLGAIAWALLVSKGLVQAKSRKQVVATAAHVEAASNDPPAVLEGKKRALLAALKEVELAKQANEMPVEVYDVVKADLKKQAVTVMRALESPDAPKA